MTIFLTRALSADTALLASRVLWKCLNRRSLNFSFSSLILLFRYSSSIVRCLALCLLFSACFFNFSLFYIFSSFDSSMAAHFDWMFGLEALLDLSRALEPVASRLLEAFLDKPFLLLADRYLSISHFVSANRCQPSL